MTLKNFRAAAEVLIVFNLIGTVVSWTAHLVKPGTSNVHALYAGTEFTSPVIFTAFWIVFVLMMLRAGVFGTVRTVGAILMTLSALIFLIGETSELFKSNVGISSGKWDFVKAASGVGVIIALVTVILGVGYLVTSRRA
jgi:hypothetical protein